LLALIASVAVAAFPVIAPVIPPVTVTAPPTVNPPVIDKFPELDNVVVDTEASEVFPRFDSVPPTARFEVLMLDV
jgi:hypothetical protein